MTLDKRGELSMEYVVVFILLLALIIIFIIYSGILRQEGQTILQKIWNILLLR